MTAASAPSDPLVTAGLLVIGDEILSGRTKDKNIGYIAEYLTAIGVDLREVRVVPDVEDDIVAALNALRARYDRETYGSDFGDGDAHAGGARPYTPAASRGNGAA